MVIRKLTSLFSWPNSAQANGCRTSVSSGSRKATGKINVAGSTKIPDDELRTISVRELNRKLKQSVRELTRQNSPIRNFEFLIELFQPKNVNSSNRDAQKNRPFRSSSVVALSRTVAMLQTAVTSVRHRQPS